MNDQSTNEYSRPDAPPDFLAGGGEMGRYIASKDWSQTALGPLDTWPQSLRTTVSLALASNFPISLAWGSQFTQIYNDGYWPITGAKHPTAMGQDYRECWASAWPAIGAAFDRAVKGETSYIENQRMFLDRKGYLEETFFTFSFSPIRDESGHIGGLFHPVTEQTEKMLSERRTRALRDLAARTSKEKTIAGVLQQSAAILSEFDLDLPFILIYRIHEAVATLAAATGFAAGTRSSPEEIELNRQSPWPIDKAIAAGAPLEVADTAEKFSGLACGPYPEVPHTVFLLPLTPAGNTAPTACIVAGASPRLPMTDAYRGFYDLLTSTIAAAVGNAQAYEDERRRAEGLAAIDRAKTAFFSNVSHEFRTPLTLMLGPLEEALADTNASAQQRERLELAHRNALRLQKLVNSLLDFSRIEAGRIQATYQPTDLADFTNELCSMFRSAFQRAGLTLEADCEPLPAPVYVDRDMWEKIVLNLLSNALKHTFEGTVRVSLKQDDHSIKLTVADSGIGVAADQLPHLFERFHRVANARSRTHEGSGIGLALVLELAKLHGGNISVQSVVDEGTSFTVTIPKGTAHLPADRIQQALKAATVTQGATPYVAEALRWTPDAEAPSSMTEADSAGAWPLGRNGGRARILLADDNADMRQYLCRLLEPYCTVQAVADGEAALAAARKDMPDLLLSDIMMPRLDGFELLRAVRADAVLHTLPVILLSARAGEEARIEGLQAGADDYLTKPFNARELVARVQANLELFHERSRQNAEVIAESEARFRTLADQVPVALFISGLKGEPIYWNKYWLGFTGLGSQEAGQSGWRHTAHPDDLELTLRTYEAAATTHQRFTHELRLRRHDGVYRWFQFTAGPRFGAGGVFIGYAGIGIDISHRKESEAILESLVHDRTVELQRSNEDLQQFAHVTSHDLKEPARKIKTFVSMLNDDTDSRFSERSTGYLLKIQSAANRMFTMINGVLSYSSVTSSEMTRELIDLSSLLQEIAEDLEVPMHQSGAQLIYKNLPGLQGSTVLLYQLFYNLVNNALKFARPGLPPVIHISGNMEFKDGQDWVSIVVADNGIGFDPAKAEVIFDTFTRLHSKDKYEGTGLGLALCRKIVGRHGGHITASAMPGEGARFTILLPV
jgi:PAS domain S-box-containing protein